MRFTIGKWEIDANPRARRPWTHMKLHKNSGNPHFVWGRISIAFTNMDTEIGVCVVCGSDSIGEISYSDEGITRCNDCGAIECGYEYITLREFERRQVS
jgi:hypothetical protein